MPIIFMKQTRDLVLLSLLVALAIALRGIESLIPNPLPWLRLGLANMMTLLAMLLFGFKAALLLTALRIVIASILFGYFLAPTFFLSLVAGIVSAAAMGVTLRFGGRAFSPVGVSVVGAVAHNFAQLATAYWLIIKHAEIFMLFPFLSILGILTGCFNGWAVVIMREYAQAHLDDLLPASIPKESA